MPTDDPDWADGNFELVSSDNIRFKIKDYVLFAASPVFADADAMVAKLPYTLAVRLSTSSTSVTLTDTEMETAKVVRMFLVLATTYRVPFAMDDYSLRGVTSLLFFLRKWGCDNMYSLAMDQIKQALQKDKVGTLRVFEMGARLDEVELAVAAVKDSLGKNGRDDVWWTKSDPNSHRYAYPFDARGWSYRFHHEHRIPLNYLVAISSVGWKLDWSSFGQRLELAKEAAKEQGDGDPVFAAAQAMAGDATGSLDVRVSGNVRTVSLTDEDIETADVVRLFLVVATTSRIPVNKSDSALALPTRLLRFLHKYDWKLYPLRVFNMAAILDDVDLAVDAIKSAKHGQDGDPWYDGIYVPSNIPGPPPISHFDPRGWTLRFYKEHSIPPEYLAALTLASRDNWGDDAENFAYLFKKELTRIKK